MPRVRLSLLQTKLFRYLKRRGSGEFDLDEIVPMLYPARIVRPENPRTCAASVVQTLANKFDCQCCFIDRVTKTGRGHKARYKFRIECCKPE
jgi:hypothetical protein